MNETLEEMARELFSFHEIISSERLERPARLLAIKN
jgi:hypothetical protein